MQKARIKLRASRLPVLLERFLMQHVQHRIVILPEKIHEVIMRLHGQKANRLLRPSRLLEGFLRRSHRNTEFGMHVAVCRGAKVPQAPRKLVEGEVAPGGEQTRHHAVLLWRWKHGWRARGVDGVAAVVGCRVDGLEMVAVEGAVELAAGG